VTYAPHRDFRGLMADRTVGRMYVPFEAHVSGLPHRWVWQRGAATDEGMQTYRQARAWQAHVVARFPDERLGWSEVSR